MSLRHMIDLLLSVSQVAEYDYGLLRRFTQTAIDSAGCKLHVPEISARGLCGPPFALVHNYNWAQFRSSHP